jgi:hypothetical protein
MSRAEEVAQVWSLLIFPYIEVNHADDRLDRERA